MKARQQGTPCWEYHVALIWLGTRDRREYFNRDEQPANCRAAPDTGSPSLQRQQKGILQD
jgi:hypothetical protein